MLYVAMVFNNADIPKVVNFTPEVLEDTYVDMEIELPRYGEGTKFSILRNVYIMKIVSQ